MPGIKLETAPEGASILSKVMREQSADTQKGLKRGNPGRELSLIEDENTYHASFKKYGRGSPPRFTGSLSTEKG